MRFDVLPPDHVTVVAATDAIHTFAGMDVDRCQAAIILPLWEHMGTLTDREVRSILLAFPEPPGGLHRDAWLSTHTLNGDPTES